MRPRGYLKTLGRVIVVAGVTGGLAWAQTSPGIMMSGTIASVDAHQDRVTIKTGLFAIRDFMVDQQTTISNGAQSLALEDLKPGAAVNVGYFLDEHGRRVARVILVDAAFPPHASSRPRPAMQDPEKPGSSEPAQSQPRRRDASQILERL